MVGTAFVLLIEYKHSEQIPPFPVTPHSLPSGANVMQENLSPNAPLSVITPVVVLIVPSLLWLAALPTFMIT